MKYDTLNEFIIRTGKSRSSIIRFYNKNKELDAETKWRGKWKVYPIEHAKYFDSEIMHAENKALQSENQSMKNLINCLAEQNSLEYTLWGMDWSFFVTVAYKNERNQKSCYRQMSGLYNHLIEKYGADTALNLFFTTEAFAERKGYHNHFILYVENKALHDKITKDIIEYFSYDRVDFRAYDKCKAGLWYISKNGLYGEDYDIMGNNLGGNLKKIA